MSESNLTQSLNLKFITTNSFAQQLIPSSSKLDNNNVRSQIHQILTCKIINTPDNVLIMLTDDIYQTQMCGMSNTHNNVDTFNYTR